MGRAASEGISTATRKITCLKVQMKYPSRAQTEYIHTDWISAPRLCHEQPVNLYGCANN